MGPLRDVTDPEFLRWSNLRVVLSIGLVAGLVTGLFRAAVHGWGGMGVGWVVGPAAWIPVVLIGLHLYVRRRRSSGPPEA